MTNDFLVPVTAAIQDFRDHLKCHPRTILSAKYGDGKSFFLDAFVKDKEVKKEFQFLTIYPVNYQVLENQDIFDVIKYDILIQMGLKDMIDDSFEISSRDAFLYCLKTNGLGLLESLFKVAGSIEAPSTVKAIGKIGAAAVGVVKKIKDTADDYKHYKEGDLGIVDKYIGKVDEISIYEEDPVTKIIKGNIETWRKKKGNGKKRIVLLFEDMDRIDPAHLFRILNIFSAHMDNSYKFGVRPDDSLVGNKFGVDNVVMVIHFDNLRSIFHHFYGKDTCFEGYIHKFADKGKFNYSLKAETVKYYYNSLQKLTGVDANHLLLVLPEERVRQKTLRELGNSLDEVSIQCREIGDVNMRIPLLMTCMRRLGMDDLEIVSSFRRVVFQDYKTWLTYFYPYLKFFDKLEESSVYISDNERHMHGFYFSENQGAVTIGITSVPSAGPFLNINEFVGQVLSLVIK